MNSSTAETRARKIKTGTTGYCFECLDGGSIKKCFEQGGSAGLRDLIDLLLTDVDVLVQLADAVDAGEAYAFRHDQICTWAGWG